MKRCLILCYFDTEMVSYSQKECKQIIYDMSLQGTFRQTFESPQGDISYGKEHLDDGKVYLENFLELKGLPHFKMNLPRRNRKHNVNFRFVSKSLLLNSYEEAIHEFDVVLLMSSEIGYT